MRNGLDHTCTPRVIHAMHHTYRRLHTHYPPSARSCTNTRFPIDNGGALATRPPKPRWAVCGDRPARDGACTQQPVSR
eukprot:7384379-Prymnesium_polylepis.1